VPARCFSKHTRGFRAGILCNCTVISNGLIVHNMLDAINDKFLINKIALEEGMLAGFSDGENEMLQDAYLELEEKFGAEEAARRLLETVSPSSPFRDRFPFVVGNDPVVLPDFHYRDPLRLISPAMNARVLPDDLKFIWQPVENAEYYKLDVSRIEKKGTTTAYHPVISHDFIEGNQIAYQEILRSNDTRGAEEECSISRTLRPKETYGYRVVAYDGRRRIITASSMDMGVLSIFSVKESP